MEPVVVRDLEFGYKEKKLFQGLNLEVKKGEVLALVGLSGSGKSTLCYCISGIIPLIKGGEMRGEVILNGTPTTELGLPKISRTLGIIFQNPDTQLFLPTVEDEIAFGPENFGLSPEEIEKRITDSLNKVGLEKYRHKNPKELSGGEKQLVALASVLSLQPEILIFDEAMSQLDPEGREMVKDLILKLKKEGKTIITVEHDLDNLHVADRVKLLKKGKLTDFCGYY